MIERLEGELLEVDPTRVLVDVGGVGILVRVPRPVADRLQGQKRGVLWTRLLVRDGEPLLYGFTDRKERDCFDSLLAVNGVGARIALGILSSLEPTALALAVESASPDPLLTVTGVGRKLANRIILELKGRLPAEIAGQKAALVGGPGAAAGTDAVRALTALGYPPNDASEAVRQVLANAAGDPPPLDELIRAALIALNRARG